MERIGCLSSVGGMKSIGDPGGAGRAEQLSHRCRSKVVSDGA